jgi:hypothetical protein
MMSSIVLLDNHGCRCLFVCLFFLRILLRQWKTKADVVDIRFELQHKSKQRKTKTSREEETDRDRDRDRESGRNGAFFSRHQQLSTSIVVYRLRSKKETAEKKKKQSNISEALTRSSEKSKNTIDSVN